MVINIGEGCLYTLSFANDQVLIANMGKHRVHDKEINGGIFKVEININIHIAIYIY